MKPTQRKTRPWSDAERWILRSRYADTKNTVLAQRLNRSVGSIFDMADRLGLKKSRAFYGRLRLERCLTGIKKGFPKGHIPWNKGMAGLHLSRETEFKPGNRSPRECPVGSERFSKEGYLQRKVTATGYPPRDWIGVHILTWEARHGPVPAGHVVCFRDGDKTNFALANLECISRKELMRRNTVHNLPPKLLEVINLKRSLTRKINEHDRHAARAPVRDARRAQR